MELPATMRLLFEYVSWLGVPKLSVVSHTGVVIAADTVTLTVVALGVFVAPTRVSVNVKVGVPAALNVPERVVPDTMSVVLSELVAEIVDPLVLPEIVTFQAVPAVAVLAEIPRVTRVTAAALTVTVGVDVLGVLEAPARVSVSVMVGVPAAENVPEMVVPETVRVVPSELVPATVELVVLPVRVAVHSEPVVAVVRDSVRALNTGCAPTVTISD